MTQETCNAIMRAYRKAVLDSDTEKVTIADICRLSDVSRKTFYAYFESKTDLLETIFYEDAYASVERLLPRFPKDSANQSVFLLTEMIYQGIFENREFYSKLVSLGGGPVLEAAIKTTSDQLHANLVSAMNTIDDDSDGAKLKKHYARYFAGAAEAALIVEWIRRGYDVSPHVLASWTGEWSFPGGIVGFNCTIDSDVVPLLH